MIILRAPRTGWEPLCLKEKGGDGNGYIPSFKPFIFRRYVPDRIADLH